MDLMGIRRGLMMGQKTKQYKKIEFALDGAVHNFSDTVPNDNFSMLISIPPIINDATLNFLYMSSTNSTNSLRYFQLGVYRTYYYLDVGKGRRPFGVDTHPTSQSHRFAFSVSNGQSHRCCDNTAIYVSPSDINNAGTIICNQNKKNQLESNLVTAYLYDRALTDSELQNFTQNGILP